MWNDWNGGTFMFRKIVIGSYSLLENFAVQNHERQMQNIMWSGVY